MHRLLEVLGRGVGALYYLRSHRAVGGGQQQVYQFDKLNVVGGVVVHKLFVAHILCYRTEEIAHRSPRGAADARGLVGSGRSRGGVARGGLYAVVVGEVEGNQHRGELLGRVEEGYLLVGLIAVGYILEVVVADAEVEEVACHQLLARVAIVDVLASAAHEAYRVTCHVVRLNTIAEGLQILYNNGGNNALRSLSVRYFHYLEMVFLCLSRTLSPTKVAHRHPLSNQSQHHLSITFPHPVNTSPTP